MSPWRMMNEWGVPPVHLHTLTYEYAKRLSDKGMNVPAIAVAGGFTFEDQIFKGWLSALRSSSWSEWPGRRLQLQWWARRSGGQSAKIRFRSTVERFGNTKDEIFVTASELRKELGDREFEKIPTGALGLYTYYERLAQGLRRSWPGAGSSQPATSLATICGRDKGSRGDQRNSIHDGC